MTFSGPTTEGTGDPSLAAAGRAGQTQVEVIGDPLGLGQTDVLAHRALGQPAGAGDARVAQAPRTSVAIPR